MQQFAELPPLSLYIHLPWCVRKCPYCDFNSHESRDGIPEQDYIDALLRDLDQQLPQVWGRSIQSIFIGGGTPSLFSPDAIDSLLSACRARLNLNPTIEITLEANPGTAEQAKFSGFREAGVNRLSIGIQSFNNAHLQQLGRIHSAKEAIKAVEMAHKAEFENINLDLMYGLPGQTVGEARGDIQCALALSPTHLSHYQLTIEPNTLFHRYPPLLPNDDSIIDIETECREQLALAGYERYEISAFARHGARSVHNLNYWLYGDYLAIGAGAHGKRTDAHAQRIIRTHHVKNPRDYLAARVPQDMIAGEESPDLRTSQFEFMLNALRLIEGFDTEILTLRTGGPITNIEPILKTAEQRGLIEWELKRITPTQTGLQYLNELTELFLPD